MVRILLVTCLVSFHTARVCLSQSPAVLEPGQHVRVAYRCKLVDGQVVDCNEHRSPRTAHGFSQGLQGDTLHLLLPQSDTTLAIPRSAIDSVWVADGKRGNFWAGAGIGLLVGAVVGGAIASSQEFCTLECGPATPFGVILGAPLGAIIGGVAGSQIRSDRWRPLTGFESAGMDAPLLWGPSPPPPTPDPYQPPTSPR